MSTDIDTIDTDAPLSFEDWYSQLVELAQAQAWDIGAPEDYNMWREYWEDGDLPNEALEDDQEHA